MDSGYVFSTTYLETTRGNTLLSPSSENDLVLETTAEFLVREDNGVQDDNFSRNRHIATCGGGRKARGISKEIRVGERGKSPSQGRRALK